MQKSDDGAYLHTPALTRRVDEPLLTEQELAVRWNVNPKTLRNQRVSGSPVPFIRIGRLVRYPLGPVVEYENRRTRFSTTN